MILNNRTKAMFGPNSMLICARSSLFGEDQPTEFARAASGQSIPE
jgi:hypothetical protein